MLSMLDYSSIMNWAIGVMINGEYPWFLSKLSRFIGKFYTNLVFAVYFIVVIWLYDAWLIPGINAVMSVKLVTKMAIKAAIMVYKREWSWGTWYETSLRLVHVHPYAQFGIRL